MITTTYFKNLEFIAGYTSKKERRDNRSVVTRMIKAGFSDGEINQITESESFLRLRPSQKLTCYCCGKEKTKSCFPEWLSNGYQINRCNLCNRKNTRENYANIKSIRDQRKKENQERPTTELKRKFKIY